MKAVKRFKKLLFRKRPELMEGIFGRSSRISTPPDSLAPTTSPRPARSAEGHDRKPLERALTAEGVHHDIDISEYLEAKPRETSAVSDTQHAQPARASRSSDEKEHGGDMLEQAGRDAHHAEAHRAHTVPEFDHAKGHAHDPLMDTLFLNIGAGAESSQRDTDAGYMVSESPSGVDMNVYEAAYQEEMKRILDQRGRSATMYLTRRVEHNKDIREHESIIGHLTESIGGLAGLVQRARGNPSREREDGASGGEEQAKGKFDIPGLVQKARHNRSVEGGDDKDDKEGKSQA